MRRSRDLFGWALVALAGAAALAAAFPRVFPFYPDEWSISKQEAETIALERFRDLGPPVEDGFVVSALRTSTTLERRMLETAREEGADLERLRESLPARELLAWWVRVYPPGARPPEWAYRAIVAADGEVVDLELRVPPDEAVPDADPDAAVARARALVTAQGLDLDRFGPPVVRRTDLEERSDLTVRFPALDADLGPDVPYGVEVTFAGDRLTGFRSWLDDPERNRLAAALQPINLLSQLRIMVPFLILPFIGVLFLRRYHEGEVGVRRAVQIFLVVFAAGAVLIGLAGASATEGQDWGVLSRVQVAWAWGLQILVFWFPALGMLAAVSWAVGEAICREGAPGKLAAFDALFRGAWANATFARSAFRGFAAGLGLAGLLLVLLLLPGSEAQITSTLGPWWESGRWAGLALIGFLVAYVGAVELFARLFLLSALTRRVGPWVAGAVVAAVSALLFWPAVSGVGIASSVLLGLVASTALVALFLAYDLLTSLLAALTAHAATATLPLLFADDPFLQLQGALPLAFFALPMLVGLRHLVSDRELVYRWEDVPPHVRRIAERERQRVELETARGIQSSILPQLPPSLQGVELAHAYLPASEVGGDFYDVLALDDGRLAVAVGDVAGHGVSSGLVMSMAKSALSVQVTFDPEVREVFRTLNRTVYQSARQRLLATLCYAVLDPGRREMVYASAGHLFPYRIGRDGRVEALESVAYPLGVRDDLEVVAKEAALDPGDTLFLFSDGIVEARPDRSDEVFGFERLEEALGRHAHLPVGRLRDEVLAEVHRFSGGAPREDDQTVLVLRLP